METFSWSHLKSRTIIKKLGDVLLNGTHPRSQFAILPCNTLRTYHVIGGYADNSFKIYKDGHAVHTVSFHEVTIQPQKTNCLKKPVTAVNTAYIARVKCHYIVAASKDFQITIWKFDFNKKNSELVDKEPLKLQEHHNEILALYVEKTLGLIISSDKVGYTLIFT